MEAVVIDSTVLYSDPRMSRAHFRVVRTHASRGSFKLVVPEVVVQEAIAKFQQRLTDAYEQMQKGAIEVERLGLPSPIPDELDQIRNLRAYESELRAICAEPGIEVAAIPDISHTDLVERAVAKRKPFSARGAGYRDVLIWESVLAAATEGEVALVTSNTSDFCDPSHSGLADQLREDIESRRLGRSSVKWYRDLRSFMDGVIPGADRAFEEVRDRLERDEGFLAQAFTLLETAVADYQLWSARGLGLPTDTPGPTVSWLKARTFVVADAYELENGEIVLDVVANGDAHLEFFAPKFSAWADELDIFIEDADWNESIVKASAIRPLIVTATVAYDPDDHVLFDLDVTDAESPAA